MEGKTIEMDIASLERAKAPYNPRKIEGENLAKLVHSLETYGQVENIILNKRTGNIVSGHQRIEAAKHAGIPRLTVLEIDITESKEKALNIALNNSRLQGEWDMPKLEIVMHDIIQAPDIDIEDTGFDLEDYEVMFPPDPSDVEEVEVPEPPEEPTSRPGDVYTIDGKHRVMCGDSTKAEDMEMLMGGAKADLCLTDPPYGVSYASKNEFLNAVAPGNRIQTPIEGDHKSEEEMTELWSKAFTNSNNHMHPGAPYYTTGPQGGDLLLLLLSLKESGLKLKHMLIWAKNNHVLGRSDYHYKHEPIIYGWKEGGHKFYGGHSQTSLWEVDKPHQSKLHPTMKPVELFSRAVRNSSKPGSLILDPFLGSGTTLIAADQLSRTCYGMEIDPRYCDVIIARYKTYKPTATIEVQHGIE